MTNREGQQLGNYRLLHLIGQGSSAEVYLGEHLHLNIQAAIKVLHTQFTAEEKEQFYAEGCCDWIWWINHSASPNPLWAGCL